MFGANEETNTTSASVCCLSSKTKELSETPETISVISETSEDRSEVNFSESNVFGDNYRNYVDSVRHDTVSRNYYEQHTKMTVDCVRSMHSEWLKFDKGEHTVMEVIEMLDELVDDSDPDCEFPNSVHDFQTAERIREAWPNEDWFHLVGLLHDMGKIMSLKGAPQWCVVGDTFPVGCAFSKKCVFPEFFEGNADSCDPTYSTKTGIYTLGCGISNLLMAWGHDEYMYQALMHNGCTIPEKGLWMIRFHSFYPWHDARDYTYLESPEDVEMLRWVREFNRFDLYSKGDKVPDIDSLKPYYETLLEKYGLAGKLHW